MSGPRREFLATSAMATAGIAGAAVPTLSALGQASESTATIVMPAVTVNMGSVFPAGGVYFRKSNPPSGEWARDHATAHELGMNTFRHWFMWSALEVAPGKWDWA